MDTFSLKTEKVENDQESEITSWLKFEDSIPSSNPTNTFFSTLNANANGCNIDSIVQSENSFADSVNHGRNPVVNNLENFGVPSAGAYPMTNSVKVNPRAQSVNQLQSSTTNRSNSVDSDPKNVPTAINFNASTNGPATLYNFTPSYQLIAPSQHASQPTQMPPVNSFTPLTQYSSFLPHQYSSNFGPFSSPSSSQPGSPVHPTLNSDPNSPTGSPQPHNIAVNSPAKQTLMTKKPIPPQATNGNQPFLNVPPPMNGKPKWISTSFLS